MTMFCSIIVHMKALGPEILSLFMPFISYDIKLELTFYWRHESNLQFLFCSTPHVDKV